MDPLAYIQNKIKLTLEKNKGGTTESDIVAENLVASVLQVLIHDHSDTLRAIQETIANLSDEKILEHPQVKRILDASIEKVCHVYKNEYIDTASTMQAMSIITSDIGTLLKTSRTTWDLLREKTYQEIMNDATPGSDDERVFLWIEEIKKGTGITPNINETVGAYSKRAITSFLKNQ